MFFLIIILFTSVIMLASVYYAFMAGAKPTDNILLGVTLRTEFMQHPKVLEIVQDYRKSIKRLMLLCLLLHIPIIPATNWYLSVFLSLYTGWCVLLFAGGFALFQKAFKRLYALKMENGWLSENTQHLITIDTELSRLSTQMPLSPWWFLPSFFLCLTPFFILGDGLKVLENSVFLILFSTSILTKLLFFILYRVTACRRSVIYSEDSQVNISCNKTAKFAWSLCWILTAFTDSVALVYLECFAYIDSERFWLHLIVYLAIQSVLVFILLYTVSYIRKKTEWIRRADGSSILVDDDEYWSRGYYYNPDSQKLLAPSKGGINGGCNVNIFNMAHPMAKVLYWGFWGLFSAFLLWLILMSARLDFTPFALSTANGQVSITAASYPLTFPLDEIEEISLVDDLPTHSYYKNDGAGTGQYLLGNFKLKGYGKCKLYYYYGYSPVLKITLPEYTVYFNTKDPEQTREIYDHLNKKWDGTPKI